MKRFKRTIVLLLFSVAEVVTASFDFFPGPTQGDAGPRSDGVSNESVAVYRKGRIRKKAFHMLCVTSATGMGPRNSVVVCNLDRW